MCLQENALERQTDGLSLSLWRDLKDQRGWRGGGRRENSYHGDYDITRDLCALPQWEVCLCGGEGKQRSQDVRRRHSVKFKWQKCGSPRYWGHLKKNWDFFLLLLSLLFLCISLPWAAAVRDLRYINMLTTQRGELHVPVNFKWVITLRDRTRREEKETM